MFIILFALTLPFFRMITFSVFDPFWTTVLSIHFTFTLLIYESVIHKTINVNDVLYCIQVLAAFLTMAILVRSSIRLYVATAGVKPSKPFTHSATDDHFINLFLFIGAIILSVTLAARFLLTGIPILAPNPELAKVTLNRGGYGLLSRISEPLISTSMLFLFYIRRVAGRFPRGSVFYFAIVLAHLLSTGAKSSLVLVYITFFFANAYVCLRTSSAFRFINLRTVFLFFSAAFMYAVLVLYLRHYNSGLPDPLRETWDSLIYRLMGSGDGVYYYFANSLSTYLRKSPLDYLYDYLAVPFLAPLRLVDYNSTVGLRISELMFGETIHGPNPTMYVEGDIYFGGHLGGVLYGGCLGVIFALVRFLPVQLAIPSNHLRVVLFFVGNTIALKLSQDMALVMADLFNYIVFLLPIIAFCKLLLLTQKKAYPFKDGQLLRA